MTWDSTCLSSYSSSKHQVYDSTKTQVRTQPCTSHLINDCCVVTLICRSLLNTVFNFVPNLFMTCLISNFSCCIANLQIIACTFINLFLFSFDQIALKGFSYNTAHQFLHADCTWHRMDVPPNHPPNPTQTLEI